MTIQSNIQHLDAGTLVTLLEIDTRAVTGDGGPVWYFSQAKDPTSGDVLFNGNTYRPMAFAIEGFEKNSKGSLPQPTLTIADISGSVLGHMQSYGDLVSSKVTRVLTLQSYLGLNSDARFPDEVFYIERKTQASQFLTSFSLSAQFDMQGLSLPRRLVLKDTCTYLYRVWRGSYFENFTGQCPYGTSGETAMFTYSGAVTTDPVQDVCGKRYSDCVLRYPRPLALPTRAFPGASHVRA